MIPLEISCAELHALRVEGAELVLVDCREPEETAICAIAGARLAPMSELATRVGELADARQGRVVVYCHHGVRSLRVAQWLRGQGFAEVQSMAGGIDRWAVEIEPGMARY